MFSLFFYMKGEGIKPFKLFQKIHTIVTIHPITNPITINYNDIIGPIPLITPH